MSLSSLRKAEFSLGLFAAGLVLASALASTSSSEAATIIVQDTFTRTGPLVGSNTDTGQTWVGSAPGYAANGSELAANGSTPTFVEIEGLTFLPNSTYTLSAAIVINSGSVLSDQWLGIGFSRPSSSNATDDTNGFILRRQDSTVSTRVTSSSSTQHAHSGISTQPTKLATILDIGATLADTLISFEVNDTPVRTDEPADVTGIHGIFLANVTPFLGTAAVGSYDNVELRVTTVPEPCSAALVGLLTLGGSLLFRGLPRSAKKSIPGGTRL
jgi:hypothetical protein